MRVGEYTIHQILAANSLDLETLTRVVIIDMLVLDLRPVTYYVLSWNRGYTSK